MAVVASFTHDGQALIPPSQEVNFTDTSTGSPNRWYWDFDDGFTSNLQNPSHTFTGSVPDTFNVTMKAWLEASDTAVVMSAISGSQISSWKRAFGSHDPPDREAEFDGLPYGSLSTTRKFVGNMIDTNGGSTWRELNGMRTQWASTPSNDPLKIPVVRVPLLEGEAWFNRYPRGLQGTCILKRSDPGTWPGSFVTVASQSAVGYGRNIEFDLSAWAGVASWFMVTSTELHLVADEGDSQESGFLGYPVEAYDINIAADDSDTDSQELIWGVPPTAAFEAAPVSGKTPLEVIFNNTTTEAIGLPTTYSWKSRVKDSGDPFVQFSTEKHPTKIFSK